MSEAWPTIDEQIACVDRELGYREHVYARRVAEEKMTQALADRELLRMMAVRATLLIVKGNRGSA